VQRKRMRGRGSRSCTAACLSWPKPAGRATLLEGVRDAPQRRADLRVADGVAHRASQPGRLHQSCPLEEPQVSRHDGEVHAAALGDLADRAGASALGQAAKEECARRITPRLEPLGIQKRIDRSAARGGVPRCARAKTAYLRHNAMMGPTPAAVKPAAVGGRNGIGRGETGPTLSSRLLRASVRTCCWSGAPCGRAAPSVHPSCGG
jgi:hypothetical protein